MSCLERLAQKSLSTADPAQEVDLDKGKTCDDTGELADVPQSPSLIKD